MPHLPPPYRPLRGAAPPHFVDRHDEDDIDWSGIVAGTLAAYRAGPADPRFHRLVCGGPAMGKTALLRAVQGELQRRLGWAAVAHRCRPKQRLAGPLGRALLELNLAGAGAGAGAGGRGPVPASPVPASPVPAGTATAGLARPAGGPAGDEPSWSSFWLLAQVTGRACANAGRGLVVMLDDADHLGPAELETVGQLARCLSEEGLPIAFLLSGAPSLASRCARAGYFRWALWPTRLTWLDDAEAREALMVPAAERGTDFDDGAVDLLCRAAGGSPLDLQRLAFAAWSLAAGPRPVGLADAERAVALTCSLSQAEAS